MLAQWKSGGMLFEREVSSRTEFEEWLSVKSTEITGPVADKHGWQKAVWTLPGMNGETIRTSALVRLVYEA